MSPAEIWLRARIAQAPPPLLERMLAALPPHAQGEDAESSVPATLSAAALRLYAEVARGTGAREDALPLLAADALLTHAVQAQAELQPDGLDGLLSGAQMGLGAALP